MSNYYISFLKFSLGLLLCLGHQIVWSQAIITEVVPEEITVLGRQSWDTGLIDAPVKVEVLNKEYFEQQQYQDLSQGISDIPGVSTANTARRSGSKSALIQGFGENSVLVMIDGTPISQNSSFGFDLSQISTSDIEKVEVIKGGASALYGSQAMGGVINIVTKRPQKKTKVDLDISSAQATSGESGFSRNLQLNSSGHFSSIGSKLSLSYRDQDSFDLDPKTIGKEGVGFEKIHGSLYLEKKWREINLFTNYILLKGKTTSQSSRPYSSSAFGPSINETDTTTQNFKLGLETKLGPGSLRGVLNYETTEDIVNLNDNPNTPFNETLKDTRFEAKRFDLIYKDIKVANHDLTLGILVKEDEVNQETTTQAVEQIIVKTQDIDQKRIRSYEGYLQDTYFYGNFELSPGVRYQYDDNFGSYAAPKVNISHYTDWQSLSFKSWLTVGTGFRTPSVKERFFTLDHTSVANYIVIGNDQLEPEESVSIQLGEEIKFSNDFTIHTNFFLNKVSNLIDTVERETGTSSRLFTYDNFDEVISRGVEVGMKSQVSSRLSAKLNYTYNETINQKTNNLLANRPLHVGLFSLNYDVAKRWNFQSLSRFFGSKYIDNENQKTSPQYSVVDLRASYQWSKKLKIYSSLNNAFNTTRVPIQDTVVPVIDDRPTLGRQIFIGLKMEVL
ncbi:MAG: TonB-dependent receptor [Bacteriovoracaceae bacterium]|nr:TonB-dependent receptor [Bacteriovoracaceae bacterium]